MIPLLDLLRLFAGASLLLFGSFTDWHWRRAPHVLWWIMSGVGLALLAVEAWLDPAPLVAKWPYVLPAAILWLLLSRSNLGDILSLATMVVGAALVVVAALRAPEMVPERWLLLVMSIGLALFVFVAHYYGLIAGGADASALLAMCILMPFPVQLAEGIPLVAGPLPGAFSAFANSLLVFLVVPLGMLVWNLAHGDARFPHLVLGVKKRGADVRRGHQWPMEVVDDTGARRTRFFASRMSDEEIETHFARVQALGEERVWVTPKMPFLIPILVGFLLAFFVGDLLYALMSAL